MGEGGKESNKHKSTMTEVYKGGKMDAQSSSNSEWGGKRVVMGVPLRKRILSSFREWER